MRDFILMVIISFTLTVGVSVLWESCIEHKRITFKRFKRLLFVWIVAVIIISVAVLIGGSRTTH